MGLGTTAQAAAPTSLCGQARSEGKDAKRTPPPSVGEVRSLCCCYNRLPGTHWLGLTETPDAIWGLRREEAASSSSETVSRNSMFLNLSFHDQLGKLRHRGT